MPTILLSLGTNLGQREQNLREALQALTRVGLLQKVSAVYETAPWGPIQDQPHFLNMCVQLQTELAPRPLLTRLKEMELEPGRATSERWGPRLIDLDLLAYDQLIWQDERLVLPHPQLHNRAFVVIPLADIAPDWVHPLSGQTVREMVGQVDPAGVEKLPLPLGEVV